MSGGKNAAVIVGFMLSVSFLTAALMTVALNRYYSRVHFQELGQICQEIVDKKPDAEQAVLSALKEYKQNLTGRTEENHVYENLMEEYGYRQADFWKVGRKTSRFFVAIGFLGGGLFLFFSGLAKRKKEISRIDALTEYLEKINTGRSGTLLQGGEDAFSKLQDEIYKTVTMLYQTRDAAIDARNHFAENLANIAHQIKTPVTAISLLMQMMRDGLDPKGLEQISQQLSRMVRLEEALLLLSRIDAGVLCLEKKEVEVFTLLTLAADNLQEFLCGAKISIEIPEAGECMIYADMDWTMEAVMNLMKNCMEHTAPGGKVYCSYEQNPLYTQIRIWDEGKGFEKEDIPHLFERFYRGKGEKRTAASAIAGSVFGSGIGIGLALSRSIIESQNGIVSAFNLPEGGACFEIRLYCH